MLRIPFPKVHPRLPWRPLGCLGWRDDTSVEFVCPVGDDSSLAPRLRIRHYCRCVAVVVVMGEVNIPRRDFGDMGCEKDGALVR